MRELFKLLRHILKGEIKMDKKELKPIKKNSSLENTIRPQKKGLFFDNLINLRELSEFLEISPKTIRNWMSMRKIPFLKIGRNVYFPNDKLEKWLQQKEKSCR